MIELTELACHSCDGPVDNKSKHTIKAESGKEEIICQGCNDMLIEAYKQEYIRNYV